MERYLRARAVATRLPVSARRRVNVRPCDRSALGMTELHKCIAMNGATMGTRWLKIETHNGRTPFKPGNPGEKPEGCTRVFVGNLSYDIDEATLRDQLKGCGEITRLKWG